MHEQVSIRTGEGVCPAHVFTPEGPGKWPAAIIYMDAFSIRPTLLAMAQRLADHGYVVLLPDLYYRAGNYEPLDPDKVFASGDIMGAIGPLFSTTGPFKAAADTEAFLAYLDTRSDVAGTKVGTTGYCMGGGMAIAAAGTYPDRIAAAASFHGGGLATDDPASPHLFAPRIKGKVYVAAAVQDDFYPPEMHERLGQAMADAGVDYRGEFYEGALHGWTMADFPIYDEAAAERHWRELFALFDGALK
jgi:carboxymethylenebutenolidase